MAHPAGQLLGTRYRLEPGGDLEVGRDPKAVVSLADVLSVSRHHARLHHQGDRVIVEDLGSTNGTLVNDFPVTGRYTLRSGDRLQIGEVHFKFLHDPDVEHAYHVAVSDLVLRDGLTRALNRRHFDEEFKREWSRASRHGRPLSLMLLDLDHFKRINDQHGHACGDLVLKRTAEAAARPLRAEAILARVGGEEFAVLCPEVDASGGGVLAERLRAAIAEQTHRFGAVTLRVTASFGVAERRPEMGDCAELYAAADAALYRSKEAGRDRVTVFSGPA
jgi:diguanylate cyclase (GGDEF)-like protein